MTQKHRLRWIKLLLHIILLTPLAWLGYEWYKAVNFLPNDLTHNPIQYSNQVTGRWAIRMLILTLCITPLTQIKALQIIPHLTLLRQCRRLVGLYAFSYVAVHAANYIVLDHYFDLQTLLDDVFKRPAVSLGFIALIMLIPLAITSHNALIKRLKKRWKTLHQSVYVIIIFASIHNIMMVKADLRIALIHLSMILLLLSYRLFHYLKRHKFKSKKAKTHHATSHRPT